MKDLFFDYVREEIEIWYQRNPIFTSYPHPAWHVSENFVEGPKGELLVKHLISIEKIKLLYVTEEGLKKIVSRAFNVYLNTLLLRKKRGFYRSIATWVFVRWHEEIFSPTSEAVVVVPVINLEIEKQLKFGDIELFPIQKSGRMDDLEGQIHKLLGYPDSRGSVTLIAYSQAYYPFFMNSSAIRIRYSFEKPKTFYDYTSWPPPKHKEAIEKVNSFISLLRLFKPSSLRVENYFTALASHFVPSGISYSGNLSSHGGENYHLIDEKEIKQFRAHYAKLNQILEKKLPGPLLIGLEYFNSSFQKIKPHERFTDLVIALDALYGVKFETTYRIQLRAACFLELEKSRREEVMKSVENILRLRGRLFHGDVHPSRDPGGLDESRKLAEDLVRRTLVKMLKQLSSENLGKNYKDTMEEDYIL